MDPVTLVVTAVALGAAAGLTDTATQAIKDAYAGLKRLLARRQVDVAAVEHKPDSASKQDLRTAVPFPVMFLAVHPSTDRMAGLRWGTATSTSTRSGTISWIMASIGL